MNLNSEILKLKKEKDVAILAHYYTLPEVQDVADFKGDSLALSQIASKVNNKIILFAGVNFMAETAKVIAPDKKVLIPDPTAGCSLADSCKAEDLKKLKDQHPDYIVVSYVNTSIEVKALTDIVCTSSNAIDVINSIPKDQKIIFTPDRNLGNYIKSVTGREDMIIWDGACHVHERFSLEKILELKKQYPAAKVLTHPECKKPLLIISDFVGSTSAIIDYATKSDSNEFIVVTESGILHELQKANPEKTFIPAPPTDSTCGCNDCIYMKQVNLENIYQALKNESPEIVLDEQMRLKALKSIERMMDISKNKQAGR